MHSRSISRSVNPRRRSHAAGRRARAALALVLALVAGGGASAAEPAPLAQAHAHNDYLHPRPLLDALAHGFCSVEADVHLVDGALLVAHSQKEITPGRTLVGLYLDPLRARVRANGGRVYRNGPALTLLVDVKTEAVATYLVLHELLGRYADLLTTYRGGVVQPGAVTVIVSGNRAPAQMEAQPVRYAAVDGRPSDLDTSPSAVLMPLISADWNRVFAWRWEAAMPEPERARLGELVARAHAQGRRIRFWNTPDRPDVWRLLRAAGVDLINTDDLPGLRAFLAGETAPHAPPPARERGEN
jgi:hypothetical protein